MLSTPQVVSEVVIDGGVLDAMPSNAIWADSTTVSPAFALRSAEKAKQRGVQFLSIPVGGTREPAEAGTLAVFVGGPADILEQEYARYLTPTAAPFYIWGGCTRTSTYW